MTTDLWRDLLFGEQKLWRNPSSLHYQQYQRWIGCHQHVGIELEQVETIPFEKMEFLEAKTAEWGKYRFRRSNPKELQILWDVRDPKLFALRLRETISLLKSQDISLMGSVHVNIQDYKPRFRGYWHTDTAGAKGRSENKFGPSAFTGIEFTCNLIVAIVSYPNNFDRGKKVALQLNTLVPEICVLKPTQYVEQLKNYLSPAPASWVRNRRNQRR